MYDEVLIEDYSETVTDFEEINLDEDDQSWSDQPEFFYEFFPGENKDRMDIEMELNLEHIEFSYEFLGKIRDSIFAEDYEIEIDS